MDAVLFTLFVHITMVENRMGWGWFGDGRYQTFGFAVLALYLLLHISSLQDKRTFVLAGKFFLVSMYILVTVLGVGGSFIQYRAVHGSIQAINDAGLQNELAGKFLLLGKNPYTEKYFGTELEKAPYSDEMQNTVNPALYYFAYPPFAPILTAGTFRMLAPRLGWFDIRIVFIGCLLLLLCLGYAQWGLGESFLLYLISVGCNPYFVRATLEGSNDVVSILLLIASVVLFGKRRFPFICGLLFGLSLASKQIIWPVLPFFLLAFYMRPKLERSAFIRFLIGTLLAAAAAFLPFLVWDAQGLINGLLLYHSGNLPHSYPIHNFGFGMMLYQLGIVKSIYDYYPFGLWQIGANWG
jgi:hypothetical protein